MEIIKYSLIISLLNLDDRNFGTFGISRPIIAGFIFGLIIKNFLLGLYCGLIIEMFLVPLLPVGNFIPPQGAVVTGITVYFSSLFMDQFNHIFPLILLYALTVGHITRRSSNLLWKLNNKLVEKFIRELKEGKIRFLKYNLAGLITSLILFFTLTFIFLIIGKYVLRFVSQYFLTNFIIINIMEVVFKYLPLLGLTFFLKIFDIPQKIYFIIAGFLFTILFSFFIKEPYILLIFIFSITSILIVAINKFSTKFKLWKKIA